MPLSFVMTPMYTSGLLTLAREYTPMKDRITIRRWQQHAIEEMRDVLAIADHVYVQAAPGTGKTILMIAFGEVLPVEGYCVLVVGTLRITDQHRQALVRFGCRHVGGDEYESPSGRRWLVATWQRVASNPQEFTRDGQRCAALFFDECHLGGSNATNRSYPRIVGTLKPIKRVNVSATTTVGSQALLGERQDHTVVYKMSDAYDDGWLNAVDIYEVETGTTLLIERIQQVFGKNIEEIEELNDDALPKLARRILDRGIDLAPQDDPHTVRTVRALIDNRHATMIDLYLSIGEGKPAIFFCANIDAATRAYGTYLKKTNNRNLPKARLVHSQVDDAADSIDDFMKTETGCLFVVDMLQEGYDMPSLSLAFDCRFHHNQTPARLAKVMQRIGRLLRVQDDKPTSRYFIATDLTHYASDHVRKQSIFPACMLAMADAVDPDDWKAELPAFESEELDIEIETDDTDGETGGDDPDIAEADGDEAGDRDQDRHPAHSTLKARKTPLYVIRDASGFRVSLNPGIARSPAGGCDRRTEGAVLRHGSPGRTPPRKV